MLVIKTNKIFIPGCLPESGGVIWLRPAVRGPMLAMMSKTSGFTFMIIFMILMKQLMIILTIMTIRASMKHDMLAMMSKTSI